MIFLTGATGHTGSYVARRLLERGDAIRCLSHNPDHRKYLPAQAEVVDGDVKDVAAVAEAMRDVSACLHLAHIRYAPLAIEACRHAGVSRFICLSSTRRYTRFPCESSRAVIEGEATVEASGLDWTILRPSMIYGDERDNNLQRIVEWFHRRRWFPLVRGGQQLVQPVFVEDVAKAVVDSLDLPHAIQRSYTLAGPEAFPFKSMIEQVAQMAGVRVIFVPVPYAGALVASAAIETMFKKPIVTTEQVRRFLENKEFDIGTSRTDLGFHPISFAEGLEKKRQMLILPRDFAQ